MTVLDLAFALLTEWDVYLSTAPTLMSSRAPCVCVLRRRVFQVLERSDLLQPRWGSHPDNDG